MKKSPKIKDALISNLKNGNTVAQSCVACKISRETFYVWVKEDGAFAEKVRDAKDSRVEFVEDALYHNAVHGNATSQIFFLCNRASRRWKNIQRVEGKIDGNQTHTHELGKLSLDKLKQMRDILNGKK